MSRAGINLVAGKVACPLPGTSGRQPRPSQWCPASRNGERRVRWWRQYHHAQLGEVVARVDEAIDRYRAGDLDAFDAFDVDRVRFQYSQAAKELWKFCNSFQLELSAAMIRDQSPRDWWERAAPGDR
jgi:hypothetical protein